MTDTQAILLFLALVFGLAGIVLFFFFGMLMLYQRYLEIKNQYDKKR